MRGFESVVDAVMDHSRVAIALMLVLTAVVAAGAPQVEETSSLDQFQTDSEESQKLDYINENFSTGDENATTAQVIVEGDNVLSKQSLLTILRYQERMRADPEINSTLKGDQPVVSVANLVATTAIVREEGQELRALSTKLERERTALQAERAAVQNRSDQLNATARDLRAALTALRRDPNASVRTQWEQVVANTDVQLDDRDYATFRKAAGQLRNATSEQEAQQAYRLGTRGVLQDQFEALNQRSQALRQDAAELEALGERVKAQQRTFENATNPTLSEQMEQLKSMNASAVESTVGTVLSGSGDQRTLSLMPTDYEPGQTQAGATMIIVTMESDTSSTASGSSPQSVVDAQLAMQDLDRPGGMKFAVFGAGIITNEISASQADSLAIVSPLALLFVLLALAIGYRDILDIVMGLTGIAMVLGWTFGFMGWMDIDFNQIFIAVPVLLIGLSIDYAIHIFMRHREERLTLDGDDDVADDGSRPSMRVALGGVGIALVWVTATTVIGFLSNLTSPVPPIREFGVVSSFGIVAALLVFGVLIPAIKVELDELLEGFGVDRRKRAIGTGGGRFSGVLAVGETVARKAPLAMILVALLVTAGGAYGGSQVDTSFSQSDFLAEDPPQWMDRLPDSMQPGEYTAKKNLELVNDNFVREDSQAQILIESDGTSVASATALERVDAAERKAATRSHTQNLSSGDPAITSPLSVMADVAAGNESFNETYTAADTDGDGVPDRNVTAVYDALYRVAPDQAERVIHRENGEYRALRVVVAVQGGAPGDEVTSQMQSVADAASADGLTATATGGAILNEIVQNQLLQTVVESLVVTMVAVFLFLMAAYRITEGSATLGFVTMLPVLLSVAWILGTMYLLDIPFNVLTGMITSLTVGLGVAYSIHISERYNQELERNGSVWGAMFTAVTGTGGALLGSAATTVGGFGVLVFAILPPLQQFGFITGLTIIYAFTASVLVLPSLLVVWTRYAGPQEAREQLAAEGLFLFSGDDDEDGGAPTTNGATPDSGSSGGAAVQQTGSADASAGAAGSGSAGAGTAGATTAAANAPDGATAGGADGTAAGAASGAAADPKPTTQRTLALDHVQPGGTVEVTVALSDVAGRLLLSEAFDGTVRSVVAVHPEPVEVVVREGTLYVAWDGTPDGEAHVTYEATVPEWATDEDEPLFTGRVMTPGGDAPVGGVQRVQVVADLFERVVTRGHVTEADLAAAGQQFADGDLSPEQFERIYRAWLREADGIADRAALNRED